ncbi:uncharacterized protein BDZ99DRAFT_132271 [Mytilinidion resinicola]|uniref:Uncharacterized protein n=1 Tax=Mytilinidion resinicola TaxID=574789 RepID=A0A6A6Z6C1_9PEZI|nr:uncharacterized protein BDZ99DRAFT_132271 [Mytilinidion resinicola]KAF2816259.1 hypothetical protein BDZ99DRAFT_132271 [Mytilinidion resinicola]
MRSFSFFSVPLGLAYLALLAGSGIYSGLSRDEAECMRPERMGYPLLKVRSTGFFFIELHSPQVSP